MPLVVNTSRKDFFPMGVPINLYGLNIPENELINYWERTDQYLYYGDFPVKEFKNSKSFIGELSGERAFTEWILPVLINGREHLMTCEKINYKHDKFLNLEQEIREKSSKARLHHFFQGVSLIQDFVAHGKFNDPIAINLVGDVHPNTGLEPKEYEFQFLGGSRLLTSLLLCDETNVIPNSYYFATHGKVSDLIKSNMTRLNYDEFVKQDYGVVARYGILIPVIMHQCSYNYFQVIDNYNYFLDYIVTGNNRIFIENFSSVEDVRLQELYRLYGTNNPSDASAICKFKQSSDPADIRKSIIALIMLFVANVSFKTENFSILHKEHDQ